LPLLIRRDIMKKGIERKGGTLMNNETEPPKAQMEALADAARKIHTLAPIPHSSNPRRIR